MATSRKSRSQRDKISTRHARLRAQGLRPIRIWVPDLTAPGFSDEARRQSRLVAESPQEQEDQAFVDAASDWDELPEWQE